MVKGLRENTLGLSKELSRAKSMCVLSETNDDAGWVVKTKTRSHDSVLTLAIEGCWDLTWLSYVCYDFDSR